tara:strand:- start:3179 stop:6214 length:3036 start_codon:yes stop_codon:yes gene_type:complete
MNSTRTFILLLGLSISVFAGCSSEPDPSANPLIEVPQTASWELPCLEEAVHVVRTEFDVPHIYAVSRPDLACAQGFVTARDRFFQMDLIARNGLGTLAELLGGAGLSADIEARSRGGRAIADQMLESASAEDLAVWEAYAAGVNTYIDQVQQGLLPVPAELDAAYLFLRVDRPEDLMKPWTALHIAGVASTVNYVSGFETTDIKNQQRVDGLASYGAGLPDETLRQQGARLDIWENIAPVYPVDSGAGFGISGARRVPAQMTLPQGAKVEAGVLERAVAVAAEMDRRIGRTGEPGFGSNAWAIGPELSADGVALLGSDGHLSLTIPSFLYNTHLDTELLGDGNMHVIGLTIAGAPMIGLGTNGKVAWGHTSQTSDINDYYAERLSLGADGRPASTLFQDQQIPIVELVEDYQVSAAMGGSGSVEQYSRWVTGQGRPIFSLEGEELEDGAENPAAINIFGRWILAGDQDGDGHISAISGAASHFSERYMIQHVHGWETAENVDQWASHLQGMTSYSQHFLVADTDGNILYTGFQGMPCRDYLPRDANGIPIDGAHPQLLIEGWNHPSFSLRYDDQLRIDTAPDELLHCALSWDQYPHAKNPAQGYVVNANNAPWGAAWDNNLWNEDNYIGGPWYGTWRASRIHELIEAGAGQHSVETVAAIQGDHRSRMATEFAPLLLNVLERTAQLSSADPNLSAADQRIAATLASHSDRLAEAGQRIEDWQARGGRAASGVETFYNQPTADERLDAAATSIFNAWMGRFLNSVFDDEGLPDLFRPTGSYGRTRALKLLVDGVGEDNPMQLASWKAENGESVFFDVVGTEQIESRDELVIDALVDAVAHLESAPGADGLGGFGNEDMDSWLWGLKHQVRFDSFVAREIGDDPLIDSLFEDLGVTTAVLPLSSPAPEPNDPRAQLKGFPRPGDAFAVDAAGGISTENFSYGSGPVMRLSVAMDPAGIHGINVVPGGQSSHPDSPHFADQAALWLGNEAFPLRFYVDDVIAGATGRELLSPSP